MLKKIIICLILFITIISLYFVPVNNTIKYKEKLEYVSNNINNHDIYLIDKQNNVALTKININSKDKIDIVKELLNILINNDMLPNGFISYIPDTTKINNIMLENDILKIDFSNDLLDVDKEYEEKIIESLVYTLTSIDGINKIMIYIDGSILSYLPKSNKSIPSIIDRKYGINKKYNINDIHNVTCLTIYYVSKYNDDYYYVPITNYVNDSRDKISIIIDELTNTYKDDKIMSFASNELELLSYFVYDSTMKLNFNDAILSDTIERSILEEVVYTISLSVFENYKDVKEVVFAMDNEEILKKRVEY